MSVQRLVKPMLRLIQISDKMTQNQLTGAPRAPAGPVGPIAPVSPFERKTDCRY